MKTAKLVAISTLLIYLIFSFIKVDLNFINWSEGTRIICAILASIIAFSIIAADSDWEIED